MSDEIRPFTIDVPDGVLDDLRTRLRNTRWPDRELVDDWSQGVPLDYIRELCSYWADEYDWRAREAALNRFDQVITEIDGVDIHAVHQRSSNPDAIPLLLTHGWPGSIVEFHKVIEPLTEPQLHGGDTGDAFHVIAPSLPGYAFSGKPTETGWGVDRIGDAWVRLMDRLGYPSFVAQGGDWGSAITASIGARHPDRCTAIHVTLAMGSTPKGEPSGPDETHALERIRHYIDWDSGYSTQQKSRPQTLGYGLTDSPAGQAAWIVEKFWAWTDCDDHPEHALTRDEMLDDVTIYWVTGTATSSARLYWESFGRATDRTPVTAPTGFAVYPAEIVPPVRAWIAERFPNVVHWSEQERGGHFAALEVPDLFVADVRTCFRQFR
ncbi:MAG: epoxide hydrolase family protein [Ilumatobacteraceae bacterium]